MKVYISKDQSSQERQGSLLKSVQDHVVDTGFIYQSKAVGDLTSSKDILYEKQPSPPLTYRMVLRNLASAR